MVELAVAGDTSARGRLGGKYSIVLCVACVRCYVRAPDRAVTPIAFLVTQVQGEPAAPRLYRPARGIRRASRRENMEPNPIAGDPRQTVSLRCKACGLLIPSISAHRVAQLFEQGADHDGVLLLPYSPHHTAQLTPIR